MHETYAYAGSASCCKCYSKATHVVHVDDVPRNTYCAFHLDTVTKHA